MILLFSLMKVNVIFFGRMGQLKFVRLMSRPVNSYLRLNVCGREWEDAILRDPIYIKRRILLSAVGGRGNRTWSSCDVGPQPLFRGALYTMPVESYIVPFNNEMQNSPIQGLGHADFVQAPDGSWWVIF